MRTRSLGEESISPLSEPERFIHQTIKKTKKRHQFIPLENRQPRIKYPPFLDLLEAEVVYNPFHDLPFPLTDEQPMWGNNRAIAPTPGAPIVVVDLRDNFTMKGHHIFMIKDCQFNGRARADPHKHNAKFIKICGMFRYGNTKVDLIKLKLFPSSLAGDSKVCYNELIPVVIATWEQMRESFVSRFFPPAMFDRLMREICGLTKIRTNHLTKLGFA
ncbi:hypothetical protein Tco_1398867 [Tanacetum coccineum]